VERFNRFSKILAVCSLSASALLLGACSSNDNDNNTSTPPESTVSVSGDVAKGIVIGGIVNVHPIVDGAIDTDTVLGNGITNSSGRYEDIELSNYDGGPVAVVISAADDSSTMMKCDISAGCGDGVAFGDDFVLDELEINAVLPEVTEDTVSVAVTPLSSVAAELALSNFAQGGETSIAEAIANANTSVADRFGLTGDVTQMTVVDITNPEAVAAADQSAMQFNLYNTAIIESIINDNVAISIAAAIQAFATQYVDSGGLADTEIDGAAGITLEDILGFASAVITQVEAVATQAGVEVSLNTLQTIIETREMIASNGSTEPSEGTPSDGTGTGTGGDAEALVTVKAAVSGMRDLANGIDITDTDGFTERLELAESVTGEDTVYALEAISVAAEAIGRAIEYVDSTDADATSYMDGDITVAIAEGVYTVDQVIPVESSDNMMHEVAVDMEATDAGSEFTTTETVDGSMTTETTSAMIDMSVMGTATIAEAVELEIESGSIDLTMMATEVDDSEASMEQEGSQVQGEQYDGDLDVSELAFDFDVMITELIADNPVSFSGDLGFMVDEIVAEQTDFFGSNLSGESDSSVIEEFEESLTAGEATISLSGEFSDLAGESFIASFQISADAEGMEFSCSETESISETSGEMESVELCFEETETSYVDISFGFGFTLDVDGIDTDVAVLLSGERTGLEMADVSVTVDYQDDEFMVSYSETGDEDALETVTIENQDGVVVMLSETADEETEATGTISLDGETYGLLEDRDGVLIFTYTDGTFESI